LLGRSFRARVAKEEIPPYRWVENADVLAQMAVTLIGKILLCSWVGILLPLAALLQPSVLLPAP